jgi:hypothetical protein
MSEFISGNAGIIKKEDIVFLEILEPNPFFLKDEYKIYATTYTLDKGERKVLLESRKKYKEIEKDCGNTVSCISAVPFGWGGKTVLLIKPYNRAMLVEPFHILKTNEYCTPFPATF